MRHAIFAVILSTSSPDMEEAKLSVCLPFCWLMSADILIRVALFDWLNRTGVMTNQSMIFIIGYAFTSRINPNPGGGTFPSL